MYIYAARVRRVVDADTLDLAISLGFHVSINVHVRVLGVDAPERRTVEGAAAEEFAIKLLGSSPEVVVSTKLDRSFERYLAVVTLGDGSDYATRLIAAGHGQPR